MSGEPDPRPPSSKKREPDADERAARELFQPTVFRLDGGCVVHGYADDCPSPPLAHHAVPQQVLRKWALHALLWDTRNGVTVCTFAHESHHSRSDPMLLSALPARCHDFAREFGFTAYLERMYAA